MSKLLILIFLFLSLFSTSYMNAANDKIAMIISRNDFRDEELSVPKTIFENAGYEVIIFSSSTGKAKGMLGLELNVEKTLSDLNVNDYKAIIFVGGSGCTEFWHNEKAHNIARQAVADNKVLAAICFGPVVLANAGVLKNKRATVSSYAKQEIIDKGAIYTGTDIEADGYIITGDGPSSAKKFGEQLLKIVQSKRG